MSVTDPVKNEYERITDAVSEAIKSGAQSCNFHHISAPAIQQLEKAGFKVKIESWYITNPMGFAGTIRGAQYFEVSP